MIWAVLALPLGFYLGWAAAFVAVRHREAQADELRFALSPVIQHSVEDAARRAGC
jgi:hypothetical protein